MAAKIVRLTAADSDATADVAVGLGFNCFSWRSPFAGDTTDPAPRELLWAEPDFADGDGRPSRSGIPLLAPFPGRIANGVVEWDGKRYQLDDTSGQGHAIHGFAPRNPWRLLDQAADRVTAEFRPSIDAPAALGQWPGDYIVTATYRIEASRLTFDLSVTNPGDAAIPFGFGTHAYFRLPLAEGADPESTVVRAPVEAQWESADMIPTGVATPLPAHDALAAGAPLAGREFDTAYRFAAGASTTELADPVSGRTLRQTFDGSMTCCVIYTPGHREAICLEPYTCTPDPLNMKAKGAESGLMVIEPGASYTTQIVLEAVIN
ncbi:Aldose 1-epimerase [Botrimarina colliarenosi]|uniref:Aldose 1-epimerase n=1 Tax=Botrimarina colliarenosi TaxID=2528001 RepID=A0A5C6AIY1_9BACT|nr:aldose 1-epimerase [Botrimarina colliarenosi]TWT99427.1 Aldose 1-epimerase [Botrimarina colliarenosi]